MNLKEQLISTALEWQQRFGVAPAITSALSEYDAAMLVNCPEEDYSRYMQNKTAVSRGPDFIHNGKRYQIKATRPSGKPGSTVTKVPKAKNYEWDYLIWINYSTKYEVIEAWQWPVAEYRNKFHKVERISPSDMRNGTKIK